MNDMAGLGPRAIRELADSDYPNMLQSRRRLLAPPAPPAPTPRHGVFRTSATARPTTTRREKTRSQLSDQAR